MHANNRLIYDDAANQSHCDDETAQYFTSKLGVGLHLC
jgi:hypothetical protein